MLVLTRKLQQQIKIGEQITVTVLRIKGNTVRVGIQAPRDVRVVRGELPATKDIVAEDGESAAQEVYSIDAEIESLNDAPEVETSSMIERGGQSTSEETPAPLCASHLPLRRIRNRHGAGPLKQVVASCATLAK